MAFAALMSIDAIKRDILPRCRVTDRLEVREYGGSRNDRADIAPRVLFPLPVGSEPCEVQDDPSITSGSAHQIRFHRGVVLGDHILAG